MRNTSSELSTEESPHANFKHWVRGGLSGEQVGTPHQIILLVTERQADGAFPPPPPPPPRWLARIAETRGSLNKRSLSTARRAHGDTQAAAPSWFNTHNRNNLKKKKSETKTKVQYYFAFDSHKV